MRRTFWLGIALTAAGFIWLVVAILLIPAVTIDPAWWMPVWPCIPSLLAGVVILGRIPGNNARASPDEGGMTISRWQARTIHTANLFAAAVLYDFALVTAANSHIVPGEGLGMMWQLPETLLVPAILLQLVGIFGYWRGLTQSAICVFGAPLVLAVINFPVVGCAPIFNYPGACT